MRSTSTYPAGTGMRLTNQSAKKSKAKKEMLKQNGKKTIQLTSIPVNIKNKHKHAHTHTRVTIVHATWF